jgi:hypothetical protein
MVLAELEALESIHDNGLSGSGFGSMVLMKEQAVKTETGDVSHDGGGRDAVNTGELAKARARHQSRIDRFEQIGSLQPVGEREGL